MEERQFPRLCSVEILAGAYGQNDSVASQRRLVAVVTDPESSLADMSMCHSAICLAMLAQLASSTSPALAQGLAIGTPATTPAPVHYMFPDLEADHKLLPELNTRFLTSVVGIELVLDNTGFHQDSTSIAQVGEQGNLFEVRSASLEFTGNFGLQKRLRYKLGVEYKGFDVAPEKNWALTDFAVFLDFERARLSLGKIRESFSYEVIGSTASMPQSERVMGVFAAPRNAGIIMQHVLGRQDQMTLAYGLYKDDWGSGGGRVGISARLTGLVVDRPDQREFLHIGASVRHAGTDDQIRYQAKPGTNAADAFVDTGIFPAAGADHFGVELQYNSGPFSVGGEYALARVRSTEAGNPHFSGFYVLGSWVITGESRPYDRSAGLFRKIVPQGRWGAPEIIARYSNVDLNDRLIMGGRYDRIDLGVNWWATTRWKLGADWGRIWLDRFGARSRTDSLLARLQWVY